MQSFRLFAVLFLIISQILMVGRVAAQDHMAREIPIELREGVNSAGGYVPIPATVVSPPAPAPHRVIDKKFIAIMGTLGGAESLRFSSRKLVLEHEYAAGAPWVTTISSNQHLVARYAGIYAAELLVAYEMKKPHSWLPGDRVIRKLWWAYPAAMVAIHTKNGIGNIRTQGPGGCTSIECATQIQ